MVSYLSPHIKHLISAALGLALICTAGCSSTKKAEPYKERKFFGVTFRQLPPEPVYNRLRLAFLPEPLPSYELPQARTTSILPIFHLELKGTTLEQAGRIIANMARYTSYTSSVIASRKIDFNGLGTMDELAEQLSEKTATNIVVDHANREVRVLANGRSRAPAASPDSGVSSRSVPGGTTLGGIAASPLSPDKFSDETLERLTSGSAKGKKQ